MSADPLRRRCACGNEVVWSPPDPPVAVQVVACPECGAGHPFTLFTKMDVALSEACNYKCAMCRRPPDAATLDRADVAAVMRQATDLGLSVVSFCGGEPFVHPEFGAIARDAIDLGLKVQLTTNGGLITPERIEALKGLDCLTVSIDAPGELHDRLRGADGAYEAAVRALDLAGRAGITCGTNTVIQRANAGLLLELFEDLLERTEGRIDYVRHAPVEVTPEMAELMVTAEQVPDVQRQLLRIAEICDQREIYFSHRPQLLEHLPLFLDKWTRHRPLDGCRIPRKFIGYSYQGFYLCWHQGTALRAPSLLEALRSDVAVQVVREAAEGRCVGCNALTYSWDEEWNEGILAGKLVREEKLPEQKTTIHGQWRFPSDHD